MSKQRANGARVQQSVYAISMHAYSDAARQSRNKSRLLFLLFMFSRLCRSSMKQKRAETVFVDNLTGRGAR